MAWTDRFLVFKRATLLPYNLTKGVMNSSAQDGVKTITFEKSISIFSFGFKFVKRLLKAKNASFPDGLDTNVVPNLLRSIFMDIFLLEIYRCYAAVEIRSRSFYI